MKSILTTIGLTLAAMANVAAIGTLLYVWATQDVGFAMAAWTAFKLWLTFIGTALVSGILGILL